MAVFTQITREQLAQWLTPLQLGELIEFKGIATGIENSNFFVTLSKDGITTDYVLTIFEVLTAEQLPFYLELMAHLAHKDIPVPQPYADANGTLFRELAGKPASLVSKMAGKDTNTPTPAHCASVGRTLAQMHLAVQDFAGTQPNLRGLNWWQEMAHKVDEFLPGLLAERWGDEGKAQGAFAEADL